MNSGMMVRWGMSVASLVLTAGVLAAAPAAADTSEGVSAAGGPITVMGSCGDTKNPKLGPVWNRTAEAQWSISCTNGKIKVSGWVKDREDDGKCAQVKAIFPGQNTEFSPRACPNGSSKNFSWAHPGDLVDVYLFLS